MLVLLIVLAAAIVAQLLTAVLLTVVHLAVNEILGVRRWTAVLAYPAVFVFVPSLSTHWFVELAISPGDGTLEHKGQWSNDEGEEHEEEQRLNVRLEDGPSSVLEIVDIEEGLLTVKR